MQSVGCFRKVSGESTLYCGLPISPTSIVNHGLLKAREVAAFSSDSENPAEPYRKGGIVAGKLSIAASVAGNP
jgi:hypothetical protein